MYKTSDKAKIKYDDKVRWLHIAERQNSIIVYGPSHASIYIASIEMNDEMDDIQEYSIYLVITIVSIIGIALINIKIFKNG